MHALIVVSHPNPASLTHAIAEHVLEGVRSGSPEASVEVADLATERFDPRFSENDIAVHLRQAMPAPDVLAEQARVDRANALVLVYPVYWWSMPGLLKGWIDRVFSNGWAYDEGPNIATVRKLHRLDVHLLAVGGASLRTYARHGYFAAMRTQIEHGIFDYCGARVITTELLLPSDTPETTSHFDIARDLGRNLFGSFRREAT